MGTIMCNKREATSDKCYLSHDVASESDKRLLLYDWRESCLLIGPIRFHKSLCLPENWSELAQKVI